MTEAKAALQVTASVRVQRGTATTCACGGQLRQDGDGTWRCPDCGREYE